MRFVALLLFATLLLFPKGGIKVGDVPITWGYALLGLLGLILPFRKNFSLSPIKLRLYCFTLPFQIVSLVTMGINGIDNIGFAIAFITSFVFLPLFFFILVDHQSIDAWIKNGITFIASYGIALFIFRIVMGFFIEIPLITVNLHDLGQLESEKYIARAGQLFKLISTYNNGNLYGACVLMVLPLYYTLEKRKLPRLLVQSSLILTLSRSVWFTLLFVELLCSKRKLQTLLIFTIIACALVTLSPFSWGFIFDATLGGRLAQIDWANGVHIFGSMPYRAASEIIYADIYQNFGLIGLITFFVAMIPPLLYSKRAIAKGLLGYLFIGCSDGSLLLIPTLCFYWFLSSQYLANAMTLPPFGNEELLRRVHNN